MALNLIFDKLLMYMLFLSYTAFILMWFYISIFIFLKFIILGVTSIKGDDAKNIDELLSPGVYKCTSVTQGTKPFKYPTVVVWRRVADGNNDTVHQMAFDADATQALAIRQYSFGSDSWSAWKMIPFDIPTFYKNYSSINSLIDAVNPFRTINMLGETDSWDNLQNGIYCFANSHLGADVAFGFMIQYGYQSDRVAQFAIGITGIAKRYNIGNGWGEWSYSRF